MTTKVKRPFVRSAHNYDRNLASDESGLACLDKSLAQQHFKEECDINTILERFGIGYEMPENVRVPQYGDFNQVTDFKTAMDAVAEANSAFQAMPAHIRSRFHNNPAEFVDFCESENNRAELDAMGLLRPGARFKREEGTPVPDPDKNATTAAKAGPKGAPDPKGGTTAQ